MVSLENGRESRGDGAAHHRAERVTTDQVNPLPGMKLSLKADEAPAVQRQSDTQTRDQPLIPMER